MQRLYLGGGGGSVYAKTVTSIIDDQVGRIGSGISWRKSHYYCKLSFETLTSKNKL